MILKLKIEVVTGQESKDEEGKSFEFVNQKTNILPFLFGNVPAPCKPDRLPKLSWLNLKIVKFYPRTSCELTGYP
jgi:hypothetical protein